MQGLARNDPTTADCVPFKGELWVVPRRVDTAIETRVDVTGLITSGLSAEISGARQKALRAEAKKLSNDIAGYEKLQSSGAMSKEISSDELGMLPIIGRIARRLSQRELADLLEVSEQQIQRYESERYAGISLSRYKKVLEILGIDLRSRLSSIWPTTNGGEAIAQQGFEIDAALLSEIRRNNWVSLPKGISKENAIQILATYISGSSELGNSSGIGFAFRPLGLAGGLSQTTNSEAP